MIADVSLLQMHHKRSSHMQCLVIPQEMNLFIPFTLPYKGNVVPGIAEKIKMRCSAVSYYCTGGFKISFNKFL